MKYIWKKSVTLLLLLCLSLTYRPSLLPVYGEELESTSESTEENTEETSTSIAETVLNTQDANWPEAPSIQGKAACIMDAETGAILYTKRGNKKMYPASITKIMTALLTLEHCQLKEEVTFSEQAVALPYGSAHIAMKVGESISVKDCLYGLLLASANDCANALAEHIAGSTEAFAEMMNAKALELGCSNTHFMNANGLHEEDHYVSAEDMALIAQAAYKNETFREIVGTSSYKIGKTEMTDEKRPLNNTHKMMPLMSYEDSRVLGGKTGYTDEAGNTLVTYAKSNGLTLIVVILQDNGGHIYPNTKELLDYGFENFTHADPAETATTTYLYDKTIFTLAEDAQITIPKGIDVSSLTATVSSEGVITYNYGSYLLGVLQGSSSGNISEGKILTQEELIKNGKTNDKSKKIIHTTLQFFKILFIIALVLVLLFTLLFIRAAIIRKKRRERRRRRYQRDLERHRRQS